MILRLRFYGSEAAAAESLYLGYICPFWVEDLVLNGQLPNLWMSFIQVDHKLQLG